ncbi:MAG: hypothetical protein IJ243_09640 [Prevotella sp.]|nr:hypothetical protein [Prevotella sp.]
MTAFLIYDLKVSVLIAVCYMFYRLLVERDTLHRLSRVVLLASLALSLLLPLCIITLHHTEWIAAAPVVADTAPASPATVSYGEMPTALPSDWWQQLLGWLLVAGIAVRLAMLARSYWLLRRLISRGDCRPQADGSTLCIVDAPVAPFSWFKTIVISRQDYQETSDSKSLQSPLGGAGGGLILLHERSHIRLHHSADVLFVELVTALQWFNPVVWLLSRDLRTIHEYEADEAVLSCGAGMAQYISLLTCKATGIQACVLANGMNTSELTKRIRMMIKPKNHRRWSWLKALYVIPVAAVSLVVTAKTVTDYRTLPASPTEAGIAADDKPFALHAVADQYGRITGFSHEGEPDSRFPLTFPVGQIFLDGHEATAEEAMNYRAYDAFLMVHNPNSEGDPKWNYKDKQGILAFVSRKDAPKPAVPDEDPVFDVCEELPQFPGGSVELMKFLSMNVKYPKVAEEFGMQGRVIAQFIVEKDGSISHINTDKVFPVGHGVSGEVVVVAYKPDMTEEQKKDAEAHNASLQALKDEARRVLAKMPKWQPGKQNGKVVRTRFSIPLTFRLQ